MDVPRQTQRSRESCSASKQRILTEYRLMEAPSSQRSGLASNCRRRRRRPQNAAHHHAICRPVGRWFRNFLFPHSTRSLRRNRLERLRPQLNRCWVVFGRIGSSLETAGLARTGHKLRT